MVNSDAVTVVRVFSLNCWSVDVFRAFLKYHNVLRFYQVSFFLRGIRYLSKHCPQRYAMIGDMLSNEEHDIVLLQEVNVLYRNPAINLYLMCADVKCFLLKVWSEKDFLSLKKKLASSHPHSHYFKR